MGRTLSRYFHHENVGGRKLVFPVKRRRRSKRARRRWLRLPIPLHHQHSAARRRAGMSNEQRQGIIDRLRYG